MKNPKILLYGIAGLTALVAIAFGVLIWFGISERAELTESMDGAISQADRLTRLPIRPRPAAIRDVNSNATAFVEWRTNEFAVISRGDRTFDPVTPPAFKTFLVSEARRLSSLPGTAEGKLVKRDFPFGFKDYITGGVLPTVADLPRLQREWFDITTVVELLATNGVGEITDVRLAAAAPVEAEDPGAKKKAKKRKAKSADAEEFKPDITRFEVDFLARPEALVAVVNGAAATTRYVVIENFKFVPGRDAIVEELGGAEEKKAAAPTGGRRSRRRAAAQVAEKAKESGADDGRKKGTVTDPATAAPLKVTMTFAVYDFKSAGGKTAVEGKETK